MLSFLPLTAQAPDFFFLRRRKVSVEPAIGILKEQTGERRFLLRGLKAVQGEWSLLAATFTPRTLWKTGKQLRTDCLLNCSLAFSQQTSNSAELGSVNS